jgi:hypothetical protein
LSYKKDCEEVPISLKKIDDAAWENQVVAFTITANPFENLTRFQIMRFFFFTHH